MRIIASIIEAKKAARIPFCAALILARYCFTPLETTAQAQLTQPVVAIHDSELTRALEIAPAFGSTPTGPGTTGFQWWPTNWHYFVMPESIKEALRSDGTAFEVVSDADIANGRLLNGGKPRYPILISLASEAVSDSELPQLSSYVAAGGFLMVGSSAFTRFPDGTSRGDFALADALGAHMTTPNLANWAWDRTFSKEQDHRLVSHIPNGTLGWKWPSSADEISLGTSPAFSAPLDHLIWQVTPGTATVIANGDASPYLMVNQYGRGWCLYNAAMQPLLGHGGFDSGMYAYVIFRHAIEWAFDAARLSVPKLSPWPYSYDAAAVFRHDMEDFPSFINTIEASAQFEHSKGARGDYFFCTGALRNNYTPSAQSDEIASLQRAISLYGATIGSHNGGLPNDYNLNLAATDYDYYHWGPDEVLDFPAPAGYADGQAYAFASVSNSFVDIEGWGLTNASGLRFFTAPSFNSTRERSYEILDQLGVATAGEDKLSPFPHWTHSSETPGKSYAFLTLPVSDWFVGDQIAQSLEAGHSLESVRAAIDFYFNLGTLINLYGHSSCGGASLSADLGGGFLLNTHPELATETITYALAKPRVWSANAESVYNWWVARSKAHISTTTSTTGEQSTTVLSVSGSVDPNTAVEVLAPDPNFSNLQIMTNGVLATGGYRTIGQAIRVLVGTSVNTVQITYTLNPSGQSDYYTTVQNSTLTVAAPGVLQNDSAGASGLPMTVSLVSGAQHGTLTLQPDGGFVYTPAPGFAGTDGFTYQAIDGIGTSDVTPVSISVTPRGALFYDDFGRATDPGQLTPWTDWLGSWAVTAGELKGDAISGYDLAFAGSDWTDYVVQSRMRFSTTGVEGGGIGGRFDSATGRQYVAWVYPENSSRGPTPVMQLVKFNDATTFSFSILQQVILPASVGTDWHTVKLAFHGTQIAVWFDGTEVINVTDSAPETFPAGAIAATLWTGSAPYSMFVDDVSVYPLVVDDFFDASANASLSIPAPGVLANDTGLSGSALAAALVSGPAHGTLSLKPDGSFNYTPTSSFIGPDSFVYQAQDGAVSLGTANVAISVKRSSGVPPSQPTLITSPYGVNPSSPLIVECSVPTNLVATVIPNLGLPVQMIWSVNGMPFQTNQIPAANTPTTNTVVFTLIPSVGPGTVVLTVSDGASPTLVRTFYVLAIDTKPPVPNLAQLPTLTGQCFVNVTVKPTATDSCAGTIVGTTIDPLAYLLPGTNTIHWKYADGSGNVSTQLQTVVVKDTTPPVLICPADITITNGVPPVYCTFTRNEWAAPPANSFAGTILNFFFELVYKTGFVEVGVPGSGGYSMKFTSFSAVQAYIANNNSSGALAADVSNPVSGAGGVFGAQVLALQLNIDFGNAGSAVGLSGSIGSLIYSDPGSPLDGKSVTDILALARTLLGGGTVQGVTLNDLNSLLQNLNQASDNCQPSAWAAAHLLAPGSLLASSRPAVSDNCDPLPRLTYTDVITPGPCAGGYTIARTWSAVDISGNANVCTQTISLLGNTASVCGSVMLDCDANGDLTGGSGLAGCLVLLKNSLGLPVGLTTTDVNGAYCFIGIRTGTYTILVTTPSGYQQTYDPDSIKDNQATVTLGACQTKTGVNFGYAGISPRITLVQTGPTAAAVGSTITFNFAVTNTGNTCFTRGVQVTDPLLGGIVLNGSALAPGQGLVFTAKYIVKASDPVTLTSAATAVGYSPVGSQATAQATVTVPVFTAPGNLVATAGTSKVSLSWGSVAAATSYNLKRATTSGGPYTPVYSGTSLSWVDSSVVNGTVYYYVVSTVRSGIESLNSSQVNAMPTGALPLPWNTRDIGSVAAVGSASLTGSTMTVVGSGADIWDVNDEFRYVYQAASGDCSVVARVLSVQGTDPWAKAGVMIRESLNANSAHASVFVTPGNGVAFQSRAATGATSLNVNTTGIVAPYWLKIERVGSTLNAYRSTTGMVWTLVGTQKITMATNVYIGLAVTSHNDGTLCSAIFDSLVAVP